MIRFVLNKIKNKKWMNICLLLGIILFIGMACLNPMYQDAALQKMLIGSFEDSYAETHIYPATCSAGVRYVYADGFHTEDFDSVSDIPDKLEKEFGLKVEKKILVEETTYITSKPEPNRDDDDDMKKIKLAYGTGQKDHIQMVDGAAFSEEYEKDGTVSCIVSEKTMAYMELLLGDVLSCRDLTDENGNQLKLKVVGVFKEKEGDNYWVRRPGEFDKELFIDEKLFHSIMGRYKEDNIKIESSAYVIFDYSAMDYRQADHYIKLAEEYGSKYNSAKNCLIRFEFTTLLDNFRNNAGKVKMIIWILQIPVLVLLLVFIGSVSKKTLELEENEISMLKSRGASRFQIISIYLLQSGLLSLAGILAGIPFAMVLCKAIGASNSFMEFVSRRNLDIRLTSTVFIYAALAAVITCLFMTLPAVSYSRLSIVEHKRKNYKAVFTAGVQILSGIGLFILSIYEWKNFSGQKDMLAEKVTKGEMVDPVLFLSSSLFILGTAILLILLVSVLIKVIYITMGKRMNPALYASFLQIIRGKGKHQVISVFLIITVALGIYNSNMARSINQNEEDGIQYLCGADMVLKEEWTNNRTAVMWNPSIQLKYTEPDFGKYDELMKQSESITKVIIDENAMIRQDDSTYSNVRLMGIHTKEFGKTAWMKEGLLDAHWYEYLNLISQNPKAVLVSSNMKGPLKLDIGSKIKYQRKNMMDQNIGEAEGIVYGFVDYWPGYDSKTLADKTKGDHYLIVANYSQVESEFDMSPYEVWIKTKGSTDYIYDFMDQSQSRFESVSDRILSTDKVKNDPVFQATNGLLTISFIMILVLCAVGFLIYWILSIKSRELTFGIYRAMGVSMKEILIMLINEQVLCSMISLVIGVFIGIAASKMYIPLVQISYSTSAGTLPVTIINRMSDVIRIACLTGGMVLSGIMILGVILKKLKITQALKLGED